MFKRDKNKTDAELDKSFKRTVGVLIFVIAVMVCDIGYVLYDIFRNS